MIVNAVIFMYLKSNYLRHLKTKKHLEKIQCIKMYQNVSKCIIFVSKCIQIRKKLK